MRKGVFTLDFEGTLVTPEGYPVLSESGPIVLSGVGEIVVDENGVISQDGAEVGSLRISGLASPEKIGTGMFTGQPVPTDSKVAQGAVEQSNVESFREMIGLTEAMRQYESNQKMIQAFDSISDKAVNELARV